MDEEIMVGDTTIQEKKERKKSEKKKSKKSKKRSDSDISVPGETMENIDLKKPHKGKCDDKIPKKKKKESRSRLMLKKEEKAELMKKIPAKNEDGIAYTKFQIRQMMKRVKKGLPPVATAKELEEKRQNEARLRREEEAELAGLASTRNTVDSDGENGSNSMEEDGDEVDDKESNNGVEKGKEEITSTATPTNTFTQLPPIAEKNGQATKKTKHKKPVPSDYICQACNNRSKPAHWIYDCPYKVTVRGTNKKKKKERGIIDPDAKKVFVSGLPFDVKAKAVEDYFTVTKNCGTVAAVRLIKFDGNGRCNGQAYISFDTIQGAQSAMRLSGTTIDVEALLSASDDKNPKKRKIDSESPAQRKVLKLKVSKVLNRWKTKRQ